MRFEEEGVTQIVPSDMGPSEKIVLRAAYADAVAAYRKLRYFGVEHDVARIVLPLGVRIHGEDEDEGDQDLLDLAVWPY